MRYCSGSAALVRPGYALAGLGSRLQRAANAACRKSFPAPAASVNVSTRPNRGAAVFRGDEARPTFRGTECR